MFVMWEVLFKRLKSVQILTISLMGLEPISYTSAALVAQCLNVRLPKVRLGKVRVRLGQVRHYYYSDCPYPTA